jgi:hypothetical protein
MREWLKELLIKYKCNIWKMRDDKMREWAKGQVELMQMIRDYEDRYGAL